MSQCSPVSASAEMRKVLEWLDRRGGLGYDAHDRIRAALAIPQCSAVSDTPADGYRAAWLELMELCNNLKRENFELREWKQAVLGKCKASDGFDALKWGGDKEGWGFIHYFIGHLETRALHVETLLAEQDAARLSAGSASALPPCPFCGSQDVEMSRTESNWPAVGCNECGALGPCTDLHSDEAAKAWSRRAAQPSSTPPVDNPLKRYTVDQLQYEIAMRAALSSTTRGGTAND